MYNTYMKKFFRFFACAIISVIFILVPASSAFAGDAWPKAPDIVSESAYIMEVTSSSVIFEKDAQTKRYPASTTKILTCLLALENSEMNETVTFSERAITLEEAATNIKAKAGEEMSMKDALYGLMLASGNDCANAIAEHIAGSIEAFADMMNERAAAIGATSSHFTNPHGLFDSEHYTTAYDMALIAREALKNSAFVEIISQSEYTAAPTNMTEKSRTFQNWNELINKDSDFYDENVIGGKTGYLDEAGRCLVSFAKKNDMTVIIVQFKGGYTGIFDEAKSLIDYTFSNFSMKNISSEDERFSFASEKSRVMVDPSAQILYINSLPISELSSEIKYADDMSEEEKNAAVSNNAFSGNGELFATINYSVGERMLGSANVYTVPDLVISRPTFINVIYINPTLVIILAILIFAVCLVIAAKKKKSPKASWKKVRS